MKKILIIFASLFLLNKSYSQGCTVTPFAISDTLKCGDSLDISFSVYANLILSESFTASGPSDTNWASTSGAIYTNPYIPSPTNDTYFWMGTSPIVPTTLQSSGFDVSGGGQVCFDFVYAVQGAPSPTEGPDLYNEGITLQYNTGSGWVDIVYYAPNGDTLPSNPIVTNPSISSSSPVNFTSWTSVCVNIPPGAMTTNTSFRWIQEFHSSPTNDHWGLDNILIATADPTYDIIFLNNNTNFGPAPVNHVAFITSDTVFNYMYTAGLADTCYGSLTAYMTPTSVGPDLILDCNQNIVQLQATGVSPNDNFYWSPVTALSNPNILNPLASPLDTIDYIFTSSCGVDTVTVNVIANYSFSASADTAICIGDTAYLNVYGGAQSYSWTPNNGSISDTSIANPYFIPTSTTTYTITTDSAGCIKTKNITIYVSKKKFNLFFLTGAGCSGASTGGLTAIATGALGPFVYSLDNGTTVLNQSNGAFSGLAAGQYTITLNDTMGCPIDSVFTVTGGVSITIDSIVAINPFCVGDTSGSLEVFISPNVAATYTLNGGPPQSSNIFTGLTDGFFSISAEAGTCGPVNRLDTLSAPATINAIFIDSTNLSCGGAADGKITVSAAQGVRPYTYSLDNIVFQTDSFFTNLDAGSYVIYAMDDNGCRDSIVSSISEPTPVTINNVLINPALCFGNNSGSIFFEAIYGNLPYQYSIDSGLTFVSTNTFNNLVSGEYILQAKDANGCLSNIVIDTILESTAVVLVADSINNSTCGAADGAIYLSATGGSNSFTYSINGGTTFQASSVFNGLIAGLYNAVVSDSNGCSDSLSISVSNLGAPTLSINSFDSIICFGNNNAQVQLSATGGAAPYQFSIDGGTLQNDSLFTNLSGGNHIFIVSDDLGCQGSISISIYEPAALNLSATQDSASCYSFADGQIVLTATGGNGNYIYALNDINSVQVSNVFTGLLAGIDTAYVIDEKGCFTSVVQTVLQPDTFFISSVNPVDISCVADGSFTVNAQGGTVPYLYTINGGTPQTSNVFSISTGGTYTLSVTDANGCPTATMVDSVNAPSAVVFTIDTATISLLCNNQNNGFIGISASGGVGPYTYSLNNAAFQTDSFFSNLAAGTYSITVQDAFNCVSSSSNITIAQPNALTATTNTSGISCFGLTDGSVIINSISGGTAAYIIEVNSIVKPYTANVVFDNLAAGTYPIKITDANGCVLNLSGTVANTTAFSLNISSVSNVSCYGAADGQISVSASGGTPGYDFTISLGAFSNTLNSNTQVVFSNLEGSEAGLTYNIMVEDANGCSASATQTITQPNTFTIDAIDISALSCFGANDASLTVNVSGGSAPYTYVWTPSAQTSNTASGLSPGVYSIAVTDDNNCTVSASQTVTDVAPILATITPDSSFVSMGENVELSVSVENALGSNLQYTWTPTEGLSCTDCENPTVTVYNDMIYSVVVTDENGCTSYNFTQAYVNVDKTLFYFMPNSFTPNSDGINDVFQILGQDIKSVNLMIFNRWGEKVFEGENQYISWDGTFKGKPQSTGVYTYVVKIKFLNDEEVTKKGSLSLLR